MFQAFEGLFRFSVPPPPQEIIHCSGRNPTSIEDRETKFQSSRATRQWIKKWFPTYTWKIVRDYPLSTNKVIYIENFAAWSSTK